MEPVIAARAKTGAAVAVQERPPMPAAQGHPDKVLQVARQVVQPVLAAVAAVQLR